MCSEKCNAVRGREGRKRYMRENHNRGEERREEKRREEKRREEKKRGGIRESVAVRSHVEEEEGKSRN